MEKEYRIFATEEFWKDYNKLQMSEKSRIDKIKQQLEISPYSGKPLGYNFFREKRFNGKRLYSISESRIIALLTIILHRGICK